MKYRTRKPTLEDHVKSIIGAEGPDGALKRYNYSFLEEILDVIHSRGKLPDLQAYHFKGTFYMWNEEDGNKNYRLAQQATAELIDALKERYGWNYEQFNASLRFSWTRFS